MADKSKCPLVSESEVKHFFVFVVYVYFLQLDFHYRQITFMSLPTKKIWYRTLDESRQSLRTMEIQFPGSNKKFRFNICLRGLSSILQEILEHRWQGQDNEPVCKHTVTATSHRQLYHRYADFVTETNFQWLLMSRTRKPQNKIPRILFSPLERCGYRVHWEDVVTLRTRLQISLPLGRWGASGFDSMCLIHQAQACP